MSYVNPALHPQLESQNIDLKNAILSRGVDLNNLNDLIAVLEQIVSDGESQPS